MKIKDRKVWNSMVTQLMKPDRLEEVHETLAKFIRHTCEESLFSLQSERKNLKNQL
jgi:predicted nucleotide-binding protein (sugar kinase/HSP70/actin superfamily)